MKNKPSTALFFGAILHLFLTNLAGQSAHSSNRKGDVFYEKKEYKKAEEQYQKAAKAKPEDPSQTAYNTGNAVFQQGKYPESVDFFEKSAQTAQTPEARADAFHNLGNAYFKQKNWEKSAEAYQNALRNRPGDADSKTNLALAKKKFAEQKKQEQEQQKKQQEDEKNQPKNDQNQPQNQPNQPQNQPQNQPPNQPGQPENQPEQPQKRPGEMSKEEAQQLMKIFDV